MYFNKDFIWGVSTAAYQIEGAFDEDGKGMSVWDVAELREGYMTDGASGNVACDHYHRFREDIALLKKLGVKAYRFSVSWPRIMPDGTGKVNEKGVEFYNNLIDELLKNGITPYITLFHWDYPYELFLRGGWLNPDSPKWFEEYAKVCTDCFSDRVSHWFTLNEPQCFIGLGHRRTIHAPCLGLDLKSTLIAAHNALLAHGRATAVIRKNAKTKPCIGWAPQGHIAYPVTDSPADIAAAKEYMFSVRDTYFMNNSWWMDPVYKGEYPKDGIELFGKAMPHIGQDDMKIISEPLDFCGMNSYEGQPVRMGADGRPEKAERPCGHPDNSAGWPVDFDFFYWGAKAFYERYKLPILIAENGMCCNDWVSLDGMVHDAARRDLIERNIISLDKAYREGVPVHGYFAWSFMDNLEWHHGYSKRFGLVYVDYPTQKRTIKDSGLWYAKMIGENNNE